MRSGSKMLPPSSAFHPHLCTPIPAFVLPQKFTRPHNDLDQESPGLKINLPTNKQTKNKSTLPPKTHTDFHLTHFPAPAQHLAAWTVRQHKGRDGKDAAPWFTTVTNLPSQWTLKKHSMSSQGWVMGHFFTFLLLQLTPAKKACEFATVKPSWIMFIS